MNLAPTYKYLFRISIRSLMLVYLWLIGITLILPALFSLISGTIGDFSLANQLSSQQFSIVAGFFLFLYFSLNDNHFNFLIQNGIGRKTYWLGKLLVAGVTILIIEAINLVYLYAIYLPIAGTGNSSDTLQISYEGNPVASSMLSLLYGHYTGNELLDYVLTTIVVLFGSASITALGMAVGSIMSLFSRRMKLIIIIGTPIFLIVLAIYISNLNIHLFSTTWIYDFAKVIVGAGAHPVEEHFNPFAPMVSGTIFIAIMLFVSRYFNLKLKVRTD